MIISTSNSYVEAITLNVIFGGSAFGRYSGLDEVMRVGLVPPKEDDNRFPVQVHTARKDRVSKQQEGGCVQTRKRALTKN